MVNIVFIFLMFILIKLLHLFLKLGQLRITVSQPKNFVKDMIFML